MAVYDGMVNTALVYTVACVSNATRNVVCLTSLLFGKKMFCDTNYLNV